MLPGSPGIHRLHYKLSTKSTTQQKIKWAKSGISIPLHHPQQPHSLNCTPGNFNQSFDQCGDHFTKKASSKDTCNSMDAGPEMTSSCPALSMPKQPEVWLSCHCRPVRRNVSISSFKNLPVSMVMRRRTLYIPPHIRNIGPTDR